MVTLPCPLITLTLAPPPPRLVLEAMCCLGIVYPCGLCFQQDYFLKLSSFIIFLPEGYSCGILPPLFPLAPSWSLVPMSIRPLGPPSISLGNIGFGRSCTSLLPFFLWFGSRFVVWLPLRIPFLLRSLLVQDG